MYVQYVSKTYGPLVGWPHEKPKTRQQCAHTPTKETETFTIT